MMYKAILMKGGKVLQEVQLGYVSFDVARHLGQGLVWYMKADRFIVRKVQ